MVLPVPKTKADELGELFIEMGRKINIDFEVSADFDGVVDETGRGSTHYYSVELPDMAYHVVPMVPWYVNHTWYYHWYWYMCPYYVQHYQGISKTT